MGSCLKIFNRQKEKDKEAAQSDRQLITRKDVKVHHNIHDIVHPHTPASGKTSKKT